MTGSEKAQRARPGGRREEGVVIVAVLWICALIMWFALQIGAQTRMRGEEQAQILRKSQAMHFAIGGCYEALSHMGQQAPLGFDRKGGLFGSKSQSKSISELTPEDDNWQPDGQPNLVSYGGGQALVFVEAESQKVNVNKANHDQLKAVLLKDGVAEDRADGLADVIMDFIDKDDTVRLHGAEKEQYQQLGLHWGPFDGPLLSLDQMLLIPGISDPLFYGYGRNSADPDNPETAPSADVPLLPGKYSLFEMLTVYGNNVTLHDDQSDEMDGLTPAVKPVTWENGGIYRILSCGKTFNGPPAVVIWLTVRYAPDTETGYEVLYRKIL